MRFCSACVLQPACFANGIDRARGANAAIACEYLFTQICGLCAQFPLVNAKFRAESKTPARNFKGVPAAQAATVGATRNCFAIDPAATHDPDGAHYFFLNRSSQLARIIRGKGT